MFILLNKKKPASLFAAPPVCSPHPHHSTLHLQPIVIYWYMSNLPDSTHNSRVITFKPWSYLRETGQNVRHNSVLC